MKNELMLIVLFFGLSFQTLAQQAFDPDQHIKELAGKQENIGLTAGYSVNGNVKWSNAAGYACVGSEIPFSTTTLTRIASISKNFTAVAVMQLAERKLIDLDLPIDNYLPEFPEKEKGQITVRQLLAHTAGVSQYQGRKEVENSIHYKSLADAMDVFVHRPLLFEPGTKFFYTTYGYVILGRIIETASGLSYEEFMKKNIFDVAGMENTGIEKIEEQYENKSCLYHKDKKKTKAGKQNDLSDRVPGGGFYSTMEDLMKFGNALLDEKLIKDATLQTMLASQQVEYDGNKYGLGWYLYGPPPNENLVIGHGGAQTGCTSQLMIVPKSKTVVVVLSNTSGTYPDIVTFASKLIGLSESRKE